MTTLAPASDATDTFDSLIEMARREAGHGEEQRSLAPDVVAAAKRDGLFCLALPARFGGLERPPAEVVDVLERVAHADGAAGWCGFIGNATVFFGWLEPDVAAEALRAAPAVAAASIFGPMGRAAADGHGGYRVDGRWGFASGCLHSEWTQVGVMVMDGEAPAFRADGTGPDWRFAYVPTADLEIVDTWDTLGLRGTGSNDVVAHGVEVAAEMLAMPMFDAPRADDPVFQLGFWGMLPILMSPFLLGVARRALDELAAVLVAEPERPGRALLSRDPQVHHELGRARAALLAARALLDDAVDRSWTTVSAGQPAGQEVHDDLALALHHSLRVGLEVVDVAYRFAPSGAVRRGDVIQRCFRDLHTARKHIAFGLDGFRGPTRRALGQA